MKKVILLHGALGSKEQFKSLSLALRESYEVLDFDFSGHGGKPFSEEFSIKEFAIELEELIWLTKSEGASIFGYSMGGYVALYLASQHPRILGKIITLGTKFNWSPVEAFKEVKMLDPNKMEEKIPQFADALKIRNAPNDWKENVTRTADMMVELGEEPLLNKSVLAQIDNEVLILRASEDNMVTDVESKWACANVKNASYKTLPQSKHPLEQVNESKLLEEIHHFF